MIVLCCMIHFLINDVVNLHVLIDSFNIILAGVGVGGGGGFAASLVITNIHSVLETS